MTKVAFQSIEIKTQNVPFIFILLELVQLKIVIFNQCDYIKIKFIRDYTAISNVCAWQLFESEINTTSFLRSITII